SAQQVKVIQDQKFLAVTLGSSVKVQCSHTGPSYYAMFWYQQKLGQGLKLMVLSSDTKPGNMEEGFKEWSMERPDTQKSDLSISQVGAEHSAVYFCAASDHSH
ncbi:hypothetical protein XELAEV_18034182mg, partial [Xenopus laevis]